MSAIGTKPKATCRPAPMDVGANALSPDACMTATASSNIAADEGINFDQLREHRNANTASPETVDVMEDPETLPVSTEHSMPVSGVDFEQFTDEQLASHLNMDGLDAVTLGDIRSRSGCSCVADIDRFAHFIATEWQRAWSAMPPFARIDEATMKIHWVTESRDFLLQSFAKNNFQQFTEAQFASRLNMNELDAGTLNEFRLRSGCSCVADLDKFAHFIATEWQREWSAMPPFARIDEAMMKIRWCTESRDELLQSFASSKILVHEDMPRVEMSAPIFQPELSPEDIDNVQKREEARSCIRRVQGHHVMQITQQVELAFTFGVG